MTQSFQRNLLKAAALAAVVMALPRRPRLLQPTQRSTPAPQAPVTARPWV